jgi:hypothetical protein
MAGYTYECIFGERQARCNTMTTTHVIEKNLARGVEGVGHKLHLDNFISSPDLFDELHRSAIICCGTV